jgi:hypothetical protein
MNKEIVVVLTNFGQIIPVKKGIESNTNYPIIDIKFYPDADDYLSKTKYIKNIEEEWNDEINEKNKNIFLIKKILGKKISENENEKNNILNIITNTKETKMNKIQLLKNIFEKMLDKEVSVTDLDLSHIANEVINDNIEKLLLNNIVIESSYNPNEINYKNTESIWLNINDITKWFKKYEIN